MERSAGSKAESWTAEDEAAMQALIARRGRVSTAMIGNNRTGGSMSEAAKRPCSTEEDESDYVEWSLEYDLKKAQESSHPEKHKKEFFLPKGVESVEKWGHVIITMDAWKKEKLTFAKALSMSERNEKMRKYLNFIHFILAKFGEQACEEPPTQAVDLAIYLQAMNYQPKKGYERTLLLEEIYYYSGIAEFSDR